MKLDFIPIDEHNWRECLRLRIKDEQLAHMSADNAHALARAYVYRDTARPFAIHVNGKMVGFIQYRHMDELGNYLVDKIMIEADSQGKGYGRAAMVAMIDRLKTESRYRKLCLCCDLANATALNLYKSLGFAQVEEEEEGEIVLGIEW